MRIVVKGAPEVISALLAAVPDGYDATYRALTLTGARVLALAYRVLPADATAAAVRKWTRSEAEQKLTFAGFLVLSSPLKTDSRRCIAELRSSEHRVIMITGDAPYTAIAVAAQTGIVSRSAIATAAETDSVNTATTSAESTGPVAWILEADRSVAGVGSATRVAGLRWQRVILPRNAAGGAANNDAAGVDAAAEAEAHTTSLVTAAVQAIRSRGVATPTAAGGEYFSEYKPYSDGHLDGTAREFIEYCDSCL
jgi:magnesium-transporting ATPase (P-type)